MEYNQPWSDTLVSKTTTTGGTVQQSPASVGRIWCHLYLGLDDSIWPVQGMVERKPVSLSHGRRDKWRGAGVNEQQAQPFLVFFVSSPMQAGREYMMHFYIIG